jgi:hypothetical protein
VHNTAQVNAAVDEVDAVVIAVFDGGQTSGVRGIFICFKDQRLLAAAVEQSGILLCAA